MKRYILYIAALFVLLCSCSKSDNLTSGAAYIDNKLYGSGPYYSLGFTFDGGKKVSTLANPGPDITIEAGSVAKSTTVVAFLSSNNFNPSFYLAGQYPTAELADAAFKSLTSVGTGLTWTDLGTPLNKNQVWIFKTEDEKYAKLLIVSDSLNTDLDPDFASCTFKWVFQPDGSTTFPLQ